jgi:Pathogenicity locus
MPPSSQKSGSGLLEEREILKDLCILPGVGKSIARDLMDIGIRSVGGLAGKDPQALYDQSNRHAGMVQDRCLLYVFRCAVYFAETPPEEREEEKLKWWWWKDQVNP